MIRWTLGCAALVGLVVVAVFDPQTEARILLTAMTVTAWSFALLYGIRSPWRATQAGQSVMATTVSLALIGTQLMTVWWFGDYPGRNEVRAVVVLALVLTLLHRTLVLWRIQHETPARAGRPE
ncbi:putative phage holin [Rhodococcus ruber]|uniref:putative phage holin n=1 Tax=Rhodococcus ruber TaxID=1830 RepID=UPI001F3EF575|nr:hypothetical protein [Rhodococcus ruber]MCF8784094.1 hypothetical protein [Rhodococcus ruber]